MGRPTGPRWRLGMPMQEGGSKMNFIRKKKLSDFTRKTDFSKPSPIVQVDWETGNLHIPGVPSKPVVGIDPAELKSKAEAHNFEISNFIKWLSKTYRCPKCRHIYVHPFGPNGFPVKDPGPNYIPMIVLEGNPGTEHCVFGCFTPTEFRQDEKSGKRVAVAWCRTPLTVIPTVLPA